MWLCEGLCLITPFFSDIILDRKTKPKRRRQQQKSSSCQVVKCSAMAGSYEMECKFCKKIGVFELYNGFFYCGFCYSQAQDLIGSGFDDDVLRRLYHFSPPELELPSSSDSDLYENINSDDDDDYDHHNIMIPDINITSEEEDDDNITSEDEDDNNVSSDYDDNIIWDVVPTEQLVTDFGSSNTSVQQPSTRASAQPVVQLLNHVPRERRIMKKSIAETRKNHEAIMGQDKEESSSSNV
ncbi:hypothetical protein ABFX02_02G102600 [Erythranthe guttata]